MGLDAQKSFAQMHEDRNMNEGIGGQMMKLDPVVAQESKKERYQPGVMIRESIDAFVMP